MRENSSFSVGNQYHMFIQRRSLIVSGFDYEGIQGNRTVKGQSVKVHAGRAAKMMTRGTTIRNSRRVAGAGRNVQMVHMPKGKSMLQYRGS